MVRVTVWLQLLVVVLILRQVAAVSDQCNKLQEDISRLERDIVSITELKNESELRADNCNEHLTKQILISQATDRNLTQSEAVISGLNKQLDEYKTKLEIKEEVLKNNNETQIQLQTDLDGLTKTVQSMNQTIQSLCETPEHACRYLFEAAKYGDVNSVKILFKCYNDNCTVYRNTPLTYAAWYGKMAVVRVLLQCGANVDITDGHDSTALHLAAFTGHLDVCRLLLDWGAKVNHLDRWKDTPLHWAAWKGHLSVVKLLVERGADVRVKNGNGQIACEIARSRRRKDVADALDLFACRYLLDAAKDGDVNTAKILIKCSNDNCTADDVLRDTPLIYAARYGGVEVVRVLLEGGANVDRANVAGSTALHIAAGNGRLVVCRLLLDWGAKVDRLNRWPNTPLHYAALEGHLSVVKLLVERGADVSVKGEGGRTASDVARNWGRKDVADWLDREVLTKQILISQATDRNLTQSEAVNSGLKKCLPQSVATTQPNLLKEVLSIELGIKEEVLKSNNETQTQLQTDIDDLRKTVQSLNQKIQRLCETPERLCHYLLDAASYGDEDTVKFLFKCSNDSCTDSNVNRDPLLIVAAWYGKLAVVRVLLEGGANVDRANIGRSTALHAAAFHGRLEVCRLLLDWGAKVDHLDTARDTPLHYAAGEGHLSVVKLLVERGADVSVRNNNGQTASDSARSRGHKELADWLDSVRRG